jgi:hypothetical protein
MVAAIGAAGMKHAPSMACGITVQWIILSLLIIIALGKTSAPTTNTMELVLNITGSTFAMAITLSAVGENNACLLTNGATA